MALISCVLLFSSCYTYRISTHAQAGTEVSTKTAHSFFWGLAQSPKEITTPICDSINANGMAVVQVKSNFGYSLITVVTLGIWSPMKVEWRCSKPCQVNGHL
jgi:hypothetical protein